MKCAGCLRGCPFIAQVGPEIRARIERYSREEIRFNLLALVKDRRVVCRQELEHHAALRDRIQAKMSGGADPLASSGTGIGGEAGGTLPDDQPSLKVMLADSQAQVRICLSLSLNCFLGGCHLCRRMVEVRLACLIFALFKTHDTVRIIFKLGKFSAQ